MQDHTTRNSSDVKTCTKCGATKSLKEFSLNKNGKDGRHSRCKVCRRVTNRRWREANRERARETSRAWREANPEWQRERVRRWRQSNPEKMRRSRRRWVKANPDKRQAHQDVNNSIASGKMRPAADFFCFICGTSSDQGAQMEHHHVDYSKPLEVFPLCSQCHGLLHRANEV